MAQPIPFRLNDANLLRIIRQLAADTSNVFITAHAKKRMRERRVTPTQVYACLRRGVIVESAHADINGDHKCTLRLVHSGDEVNAAVALKRNESGDWIAVVTVF